MSEPLSGSRPDAEPDAPVTASDRTATPEPAAPPAYGSPPTYGAQPGPVAPPAYGSPAYGSPAYGPPTFGAGAAVLPGVAAMNPAEERNWAVAAHLSGFVAAYMALGFLGPLVIMLAAGNRSPFVRRHAVEALNFNLSVLLYVIVSAVLVLVLIGIPMLLAVALLYLVTTIQGALAASRGEEYRYPLTIRFIS